MNISICQKYLMNYEISKNILSHLYNNEFDQLKDNVFLKMSIIYEYAELCFLLNDFQKTNEIIQKAVDFFGKEKPKFQRVKRIFGKLLLLKVKILGISGYVLKAEKELNRVKDEYPTEEDIVYEIEELNISLLNSDYIEFEEKMKSIDDFNFNGDEELLYYQQRLYLIYTRYYYETGHLEKFEEYLIKISELFKDFDHFRLLKNNEFLEFVKFKILHLVLKHKYDHALNRVINILNHVNSETDKYRYFIFSLLKCEVLEKNNRIYESLETLKDILIRFDLDSFKNESFKNFDVFIRLHFQMAKCYSKIQKFKESIKNLKIINNEYFDKREFFRQNNRSTKTEGKMNLLFAKMYRKLNDFRKYENFLQKTDKIHKCLFNNDYHSGNFKLYLEYARFFVLFGKANVAKGYLDRAALIIKRRYGEKANNFFNTALLHKNLAHYFHRNKSYDKCLTNYQKCLGIIDKTIENEADTRLTTVINEMAKICIKFDKLKLADGYLKKCEKINKRVENGDLALSMTYYIQGHYYKKASNFEVAIQCYSKAIDLLAEIYQTELHSDIVKCYYEIADIYCIRKKFHDGYSFMEECLNNMKTFYKADEIEFTAFLERRIADLRIKINR